jgi:hypothetical protein
VRGIPIGIVIGLVLGAGAMYLALRPPWGGASVSAPHDAGTIATAPSDAGTPSKRKKRRRRHAGSVAAPGTPDTGDDYEETEPLPVLTAADRRLEWRGDEVKLPAQRLDMSGGAEARSLDDGELNTTISRQSGPVRDCVIQGATNTDLRATITVDFIVDGSGRVTRSRLQAPHYLFDKGLLDCARRALGRLKFPSTGAPTKVTFPINLG